MGQRERSVKRRARTRRRSRERCGRMRQNARRERIGWWEVSGRLAASPRKCSPQRISDRQAISESLQVAAPERPAVMSRVFAKYVRHVQRVERAVERRLSSSSPSCVPQSK